MNKEEKHEQAKENKKKWREENIETIRARSREWNRTHPEVVRERNKKWRKNQPKKQRTLDDLDRYAKYYKENRERILEYNRRWSKEHPDNMRIKAINRRALKVKNGGKITKKEWEWLKEFYSFTCLCCGKQEPEIKLTLDHIVPLKLGGENTIENSQPLCGICNSKKGANHIDFRKK